MLGVCLMGGKKERYTSLQLISTELTLILTWFPLLNLERSDVTLHGIFIFYTQNIYY